MSRDSVDLDRFVRSRVRVLNEGGGHGYDQGIRTFDCPFCGDAKGRGWVGVAGWGAGCWNVGCDAEPRLEGGALEWARRILAEPNLLVTRRRLEREFGGASVAYAPVRSAVSDFCRVPPGSRPLRGSDRSPMMREFVDFVGRQWGIDLAAAERWDLGWCVHGPYAWRVVIPIVMGGVGVGVQARTIRGGVEPKYVTSRHGIESDPEAECGRPAAAMLFNIDSVRPGDDVVLVEGAGDAMGWHRNPYVARKAVALLGVALTEQKVAILASARPACVVVALDADPAAQVRAWQHVTILRDKGLSAILGRWVGGKDAGSGALLEVCKK